MPQPTQWSVIDSTLSSLQSIGNDEDIKTKCRLAKLLDMTGVDLIEVLCPSTSHQAKIDCEIMSSLGLRARTIAQLASNRRDVVDTAADAGVCAVRIHIRLDEHYNPRTTDELCEKTIALASYAIGRGLQVFASIANSFREDRVRMLSIYKSLDRVGVSNVAVTDASGTATPRQIFEHVDLVRRVVGCGITICASDRTGCAIANSLTALEAGATHVASSCRGLDQLTHTSTTPLAGMIMRMMAGDDDCAAQKYDVTAAEAVEEFTTQVLDRQMHLKLRQRHSRLLRHDVAC